MAAKISGMDFFNFEKNMKSALEKKWMNFNLYPKFIVTKQFKEKTFKQASYQVDNGDKFFTVAAHAVKDTWPVNEGESCIGHAANLSQFRFQSNLDGRIRFLSLLDDHPFTSFDVNKYHDSLKALQTSTKKNVLLLGPCRGGFKCYAAGIIGFMPKVHAEEMVAAHIRKLKANADPKKKAKFIFYSALKYELNWMPIDDFKIVPSIRQFNKELIFNVSFLVKRKVAESVNEATFNRFLVREGFPRQVSSPTIIEKEIEKVNQKLSTPKSSPGLKLTDGRQLRVVPFQWKRFFSTAARNVRRVL